MKKIAEKVVLIALICITFVFALTTILYVTNVIPQQEVDNNGVAVILLSVLAAIYLGLAAYLVYVNFSEKVNVKRILLFYDAESATRASSKVIDNIVKGCAKQLQNIKVRRLTLRVDEKQGLVATVHVEVEAEYVTQAIPELRELLIQNFQETLGLKFNAINFEIDKLNKKFVPDTKNDVVEAAETAPTVEETTADTVEGTVSEPETEQPSEENKEVINIEEYDITDEPTTAETEDEKNDDESI